MERARLVDGLLAVVFVAFVGYFLWVDRPLVAGIWVLVAGGFGARAVGLLPG
jgi:hypothetical protein